MSVSRFTAPVLAVTLFPYVLVTIIGFIRELKVVQRTELHELSEMLDKKRISAAMEDLEHNIQRSRRTRASQDSEEASPRMRF
jgi:hypothetical protein